MEILFEDNHLIIINKAPGELVQGDKTGDKSLDMSLKEYLKEQYQKPGNVFIGVVHRLDRPVSGVVVYAKTSKALSRMNEMFRSGNIDKTYWAIVKNKPAVANDILTHFLKKNEKQNKSYIYEKEIEGSKIAKLKYSLINNSEKYYLLEVNLMTGRHHQIRCQLSAMGCPIKGDLKYGFDRSNADGSISLHARSIEFMHPIKKELLKIIAPVPNDKLWKEIAIF